MGFFQNRKTIKGLIKNATSEICSSLCERDDDLKQACQACYSFCPEKCESYYGKLLSPPTHPHKASSFLTVAIALLAASFLVICGYFLYAKHYNSSRRNNSNGDRSPDDQETHDRRDFLDEEHGATVEHHVWYIRTVGLDPSAISSIAALKYRKDEGLIDGTDCSVCLSEFQEDEALRLLPKCSHAFHVACIDTWLLSHTNCPMCRTPVMVSTVKASSPENSGSEEETHMGNPAINGESIDRDVEEGDMVGVHRVEPSRRSVSLDCLDAKELEMVNKLRNNGEKRVVEKKLQRLRSGGSSNGKSSLQIGHVSSSSSMKRSHSCSGKFVMCRPARITDSIVPLRSV